MTLVSRSIRFAVVMVLSAFPARGADNNAGSPKLERSARWTTSRIKGAAEPPPPYTVRRVFENLKLDQPVHLIRGPRGKRLFLTERTGRIVTFPDDPAVSKTDLFIDLGLECHTIVFHPRFEETPYVYVYVNGGRGKAQGMTPRDQFFRYAVTRDDPPRAIPESKYLILEHQSDGHNGGAMAFGPDGMLYITIGDGTSDSDGWESGQDLGNLNATLVRIDVDYPDPGKPYSVPIDNPFRSLIGARPEIWAYGFRNPWRMFIDQQTGDIYVGDVGQDLWGMIWRIDKAGNYGWSVSEGGHDFYPLRRRGPTPILPPLAVHHHTESRSITGGVVYRGDELPELAGAYIYGDYDTGKIWGLRNDGNRLTWQQELADTMLRPAAFEEGLSGKLYILEHVASEIYELVPNPPRTQQHVFPQRLSETGLFTSVPDLEPDPGLIPYSVNAPQWRDHALQERYIALPGESRITFVAKTPWTLPDESVLVKTLSLPMTFGDPASARRIETQIMTRQEGQWYGYTYVWNDEQADAVLAPAEGMDRTFTVVDPAAPGGRREQPWRIASRTECMVCHSRAAMWALGMRTEQMNRDHDYDGVVANQITALSQMDVLTNSVTTAPAEFDRLADPYDESADLELRARSYFHANCAICHIGAGGGNAMFDMDFRKKLEDAKLIGVRPLHADFGIAGAMLIAPGQPERSVLFQRISRRGNGQMPPLGTTLVDDRAVTLLRDWITHVELPAERRQALDLAVAETQGESGTLTRWYATGPLPADQSERIVRYYGVVDAEKGLADGEIPPWRETYGNGGEARVKLTNGGKPEPDTVCIGRTDVTVGEATDVQFLGSCNGTLRVWLNGDVVFQRDEARAFAPGSDRFDATLAVGVNRLLVQASFANGDDAFHLGFRRKSKNPEHERLALAALNETGDIERGRKLFGDQEKALCIKCHRLGELGAKIGPDLTGIGGRMSRSRIVESILEPSRTIAPKYETLAVAMNDERILTGVKIAETDETLTLGGNEGQQYVLSKADIEEQQVQSLSLMPEGLEKGLTPAQFVDLIAFLCSRTEVATPGGNVE